jgi:hypothetical protein
MEDFDNSVDAVIPDSGCACGLQAVKEIEAYKKYELGFTSCKEFKAQCGIKEFLSNKVGAIRDIKDFLESVPPAQKSDELKAIAAAIPQILSETTTVEEMELCKTVGDLLVALESSHIPNFYTQNLRESRHLCPALRQTMIYRDSHPDNDDVINAISDATT